jgi:hypothetical protein
MTEGSAINWGPIKPDSPTLTHPFYLKYANIRLQTISDLHISDVLSDLGTAVLNNDTADVVAYLSTLVRVGKLIAAG